MKNFRVEAMKGYENYLSGSNDYCVKGVVVLANDNEEAKAKAYEILDKEYIVMSVISVEEYEREEAKRREEEEARENKREEEKARAKAKKEGKELAEAKAKGLSIEELKAIKAKELKIKRAKKELEEALALVEKIKARIKRLEEDR
jgi:hypothetical protein